MAKRTDEDTIELTVQFLATAKIKEMLMRDLGIVESMASEIPVKRYLPGVNEDFLKESAMLALAGAAETFDPDRTSTFDEYAIGEVRKALRKLTSKPTDSSLTKSAPVIIACSPAAMYSSVNYTPRP